MTAQDAQPQPLRIEYLVGRYPGGVAQFIQREIVALRALGADVSTFSVWRTAQQELLSRMTTASTSARVARAPSRLRDLFAEYTVVARLEPPGGAVAGRPLRATCAGMSRASGRCPQTEVGWRTASGLRRQLAGRPEERASTWTPAPGRRSFEPWHPVRRGIWSRTHGASRPASSTSGAERYGSTRTRCRGAMGLSPRRRLRETCGRATRSAPSSCNGSSTSSRLLQAGARGSGAGVDEARLEQVLDWIARHPAGGVGWESGYEAAHRLVAWTWALPFAFGSASEAGAGRDRRRLRRDRGGRSRAPVALLLGEQPPPRGARGAAGLRGRDGRPSRLGPGLAGVRDRGRPADVRRRRKPRAGRRLLPLCPRDHLGGCAVRPRRRARPPRGCRPRRGDAGLAARDRGRSRRASPTSATTRRTGSSASTTSARRALPRSSVA